MSPFSCHRVEKSTKLGTDKKIYVPWVPKIAHKSLTPGHPTGRLPSHRMVTGQKDLCLCAFFFPEKSLFLKKPGELVRSCMRRVALAADQQAVAAPLFGVAQTSITAYTELKTAHKKKSHKISENPLDDRVSLGHPACVLAKMSFFLVNNRKSLGHRPVDPCLSR